MEGFFTGMISWYNRSLSAFMRVNWLALLVIAACAYGIYEYGGKIPEMAPMEDKNNPWITSTAPEGTS
ncbi:MAG: hypothetical protein IPI11_08010 [Haliscomenobacter sp.]|nr:hypothetical protein [Haliscomenobacter sp.]